MNTINTFSYPDVPWPVKGLVLRRPGNPSSRIPEAPGVYFIWRNGRVDYVGSSLRLRYRVQCGTHHKIEEGDRVSFLEFDPGVLMYAEAYYIGLLRPLRNFAKSRIEQEREARHIEWMERLQKARDEMGDAMCGVDVARERIRRAV
ncbi:MAG: hypothetical protein WC107_06320 [Patescibacteria group bacterium]